MVRLIFAVLLASVTYNLKSMDQVNESTTVTKDSVGHRYIEYFKQCIAAKKPVNPESIFAPDVIKTSNGAITHRGRQELIAGSSMLFDKYQILALKVHRVIPTLKSNENVIYYDIVYRLDTTTVMGIFAANDEGLINKIDLVFNIKRN